MLNETIRACTEHARDEALRAASESVGVIVKSRSKAVNFKLTEDILETYAVSLLEGVKYSGEGYSQNASGDTVKGNVVQSEFDRKQNQFLVAKYERDLDIYDFDKKINLQDMMTTAEKLTAIDAGNATAFRAIVYVYRHEDRIQSVVDYCKQILDANLSVDISIEACAQLGDIYYNELFDTPTAKKFVDRGIALVKKKYSKKQIDKLVNGTNVEIKDLEFAGNTNVIRMLYVLKSDIENVSPSFDSASFFNEMILAEDRIYNIKYRTDW